MEAIVFERQMPVTEEAVAGIAVPIRSVSAKGMSLPLALVGPEVMSTEAVPNTAPSSAVKATSFMVTRRWM